MVVAELKNCGSIDENVYSGVFGVADYESVIRFFGFKMAASEIINRDNIGVNVYSDVFRVAYYESIIRF